LICPNFSNTTSGIGPNGVQRLRSEGSASFGFNIAPLLGTMSEKHPLTQFLKMVQLGLKRNRADERFF